MKLYLELLASLIGIVSVCFAVFFFLDARHAKEAELEQMKIERLATELNIRAEIIERDAKANAEAAVHYRNLKAARELEAAEQSRLDYLERQLERKYAEQDRIQQAELQLKGKGNG